MLEVSNDTVQVEKINSQDANKLIECRIENKLLLHQFATGYRPVATVEGTDLTRGVFVVFDTTHGTC